MKLFSKIIPLVVILFLGISLNAQIENAKPNDQVEILLKDGNRIIGIIKSITSTDIIIVSGSLGEITIDKEKINQITFRNNNLPIPDEDGIITDVHNSTHYLINPSAYGLKKGQKYYENIAIFFNSFSFGVTDNITVTVGGEIASLLFASRFPILYVSTKFSAPLPNETGAIGLNGLIFTSPADEFEGFGVVQANLTLGNRNTNFTAGIGLGFSLSNGFTDELAPFQLSFMTRIGEKLSFITDNFIVLFNDFGDNEAIYSAGLRIHFNKPGSALNLTLWRVTEDMGEFFALPFVSATIPLGDY